MAYEDSALTFSTGSMISSQTVSNKQYRYNKTMHDLKQDCKDITILKL